MLDQFLITAFSQNKAEREKRAFIDNLKKLPRAELLKLATGEVKVADLCPTSATAPQSWLEQFKGTPLFQQALQLEQQELQVEADRIRKQMSDPQPWVQQDQIRLQKRLLELQLVGSTEVGAPPAPEAGVQGAGGLGAEALGVTDGGLQDRPDQTNVKTSALQEARRKLASMKMRKLAEKLAHADAEKLAQPTEKTALLGTAIAGYLGARKADEAGGDPIDGALRGGAGYFGGGALGGGLGALLGGTAGGLAGYYLGVPGSKKELSEVGLSLGGGLGAGAGQLLAGIKGYKMLTKKYEKKDEPAEEKYAFSLPPNLGSQLGGAAELAHGDAKKLEKAYASFDAAPTTSGQKLRTLLSTIGGATAGTGVGGALGYGVGHAANALGAHLNPAETALLGSVFGGGAGTGLGLLVGGNHGASDVQHGKRVERLAKLEEKYAFSLPPGLTGQLGGAASRVMSKLGPQGTKALIGAGVGAVGGGLLGAHEGGARGAIGGALGGAALGGAAGHVGGNVAASMAKGVPLGRALQVGAARSGGQLLGAGRQALTEGRQLLGGLQGPKAPAA